MNLGPLASYIGPGPPGRATCTPGAPAISPTPAAGPTPTAWPARRPRPGGAATEHRRQWPEIARSAGKAHVQDRGPRARTPQVGVEQQALALEVGDVVVRTVCEIERCGYPAVGDLDDAAVGEAEQTSLKNLPLLALANETR